jgi:dCTP diphosphatase
MTDDHTTISRLKELIAVFVAKRDWEQYHSPKNLSMSVAIEAAELMELFQWLGTEESAAHHRSRKIKKRMEEEIADVAVYLLELCAICEIDLSDAIRKKLLANSRKYPVRLAKGRREKYDELVLKKNK